MNVGPAAGRAGARIRTPPREWNYNMLAVLLGTTGQTFGRYMNGLAYPSVEIMKKFEVLFGWPASQQIDLIPPFGEEMDLRYATVMRSVVNEWAVANPRTVPAAALRSVFPTKFDDPFGWKAKAARKAEE